MIGRLNHVAIVVPNLTAAAAKYRDLLGAAVHHPRDLPEHGVTVVFVELPNSKIELMTPLGESSPVAKFLAEHPNGGMHHVCFEVADIAHAARTLVEGGARAIYVHCNVALKADVDAAVRATLAAFGRIDALVNNAGIAIFKPVLETSIAEWQRVLAVNLGGAFVCTHACAPVMMRTGGGAVVNIASISGLRASTLRVAYGTSKAALIHLTKQYAAELGTVGIRVNCVAPGPVDTAMAKLVHSVAIRQDYYDTIPLNRYGTPEEVAATVYFLCSDEASYVNGQTLAVDGGFDALGVGLPTLRKQFVPRATSLKRRSR